MSNAHSLPGKSEVKLTQAEHVLKEIENTEIDFVTDIRLIYDALDDLVKALDARVENAFSFNRKRVKNKLADDRLVLVGIRNSLQSFLESPILSQNITPHSDLSLAALLQNELITKMSGPTNTLGAFNVYLQQMSDYTNIYYAMADYLMHIKYGDRERKRLFRSGKEILSGEKYNTPLNLEDFLIKPVQRLMRYNLLLRELIKNTNKDDPDQAKMIAADKNIAAKVIHTNENAKNGLQFKKHKELVYYFKNIANNQTEQQNRLVHSDKLTTMLSRIEAHHTTFNTIKEQVDGVVTKPLEDHFILEQKNGYKTQEGRIGETAKKWERFRDNPSSELSNYVTTIHKSSQFQAALGKLDGALSQMSEYEAQLERLKQLKVEISASKNKSLDILTSLQILNTDRTNDRLLESSFIKDFDKITGSFDTQTNRDTAAIDKLINKAEKKLLRKVKKLDVIIVNLDTDLVKMRSKTINEVASDDIKVKVKILLDNLKAEINEKQKSLNFDLKVGIGDESTRQRIIDLNILYQLVDKFQNTDIGAYEKMKQVNALIQNECKKDQSLKSTANRFNKSYRMLGGHAKSQNAEIRAAIALQERQFSDLISFIKKQPKKDKNPMTINNRIFNELSSAIPIMKEILTLLKEQQRERVKNTEYKQNEHAIRIYNVALQELIYLHNSISKGELKIDEAHSKAVDKMLKDLAAAEDKPIPSEMIDFLKAIREQVQREYKSGVFAGIPTFFNRKNSQNDLIRHEDDSEGIHKINKG